MKLFHRKNPLTQPLTHLDPSIAAEEAAKQSTEAAIKKAKKTATNKVVTLIEKKRHPLTNSYSHPVGYTLYGIGGVPHAITTVRKKQLTKSIETGTAIRNEQGVLLIKEGVPLTDKIAARNSTVSSEIRSQKRAARLATADHLMSLDSPTASIAEKTELQKQLKIHTGIHMGNMDDMHGKYGKKFVSLSGDIAETLLQKERTSLSQEERFVLLGNLGVVLRHGKLTKETKKTYKKAKREVGQLEYRYQKAQREAEKLKQ